MIRLSSKARLPVLLLFGTALPVLAADQDVAVTVYRSDSDALFVGGGSPVADGYAIVHERRSVQLTGGRQSISIDGLPTTLDPEAVMLEMGEAKILAQRVLSAGDSGTVAAHRGERVEVTTMNSATISGVLVGVDGDGISLRDDSGSVRYVRNFASVRFLESTGRAGSVLQVTVDGGAGTMPATLTYPTSGLAWRAAYSALLQSSSGCRLRLDALASIANRSGRDYDAAALKLVAGEPNRVKQTGPQPVFMKSMAMDASAEAMPAQSSLGDFRVYTLSNNLDLPDASVTQAPLYASRELDCERTWLFENGQSWMPNKPYLVPGNDNRSNGAVVSKLQFKAVENLPAGTLRVLTRDADNRIEFIGEDRVADTGQGRTVSLTLGNTFDVTGSRERTAFSVDRAAHQMNEALRITLENTGEQARIVTVREHPYRWRNWTLASSSQKPAKQSPDTLDFAVSVPAKSKVNLDYAIDYSWLAGDE
ncbi:MAG: DUF4139 domain-containing protein [Dokdonella sp.]